MGGRPSGWTPRQSVTRSGEQGGPLFELLKEHARAADKDKVAVGKANKWVNARWQSDPQIFEWLRANLAEGQGRYFLDYSRSVRVLTESQ